VHCVSRSTDKLDIFVTDVGGATQSAAWEPDFAMAGTAGGTSTAAERPGCAGDGRVPQHRQTGHLRHRTDSRVYTASWEPDFADGWQAGGGWVRSQNLRDLATTCSGDGCPAARPSVCADPCMVMTDCAPRVTICACAVPASSSLSLPVNAGRNDCRSVPSPAPARAVFSGDTP